MKQATWKVGWYSRVILTIIAVSLVGLLVRQLPKKVEAQRSRSMRVDVVKIDVIDLRTSLMIYLEQEKKLEREGELPIIPDRRMRDLAQRTYDHYGSNVRQLLTHVLAYKYALDYRVKFMNDDFIILEAEYK